MDGWMEGLVRYCVDGQQPTLRRRRRRCRELSTNNEDVDDSNINRMWCEECDVKPSTIFIVINYNHHNDRNMGKNGSGVVSCCRWWWWLIADYKVIVVKRFKFNYGRRIEIVVIDMGNTIYWRGSQEGENYYNSQRGFRCDFVKGTINWCHTGS